MSITIDLKQIEKILGLIKTHEKANEEGPIKRFIDNLNALYDSVVIKAKFSWPEIQSTKSASGDIESIIFSEDDQIKLIYTNIGRLRNNLKNSSEFLSQELATEVRKTIDKIEVKMEAKIEAQPKQPPRPTSPKTIGFMDSFIKGITGLTPREGNIMPAIGHKQDHQAARSMSPAPRNP